MESNCNCDMCKNNNKFKMPNEIINSAKNKDLILFCGAGISTESKIVLPFSFYLTILDLLNNDYDFKLDNNIGFSELMSKFCSAVPNGRRELIRMIKERFDLIDSFPELSRLSNRFHRELASIPNIQTVITTNWDGYFERECDMYPIINDSDVLLWNTFKRRVFKIHGSINNIGSIVATKEDYDECYNRLKNDLIGDRLKTLLASNTVVFIGFSFGDEDLNKILEILTEKSGNFANQYYLVTTNKSWENKVEDRIIPIITDGTFFIHSLRKLLIKENVLIDDKIYDYAYFCSEQISNKHGIWLEKEGFTKKLKEFPELILSTVYQDGIIHAFERCYSNKKTGEYMEFGYLNRFIDSYKKLYMLRKEEGLFLQSYYNYGYFNGLLALNNFLNNKKYKTPPILSYNFEFFDNELDLIENIKKNRDKEIYNYCKELIEDKPNDIVIHMPPWYC